MGLLDALIYGVRDVYNGATLLVRKSSIEFRNNLTATVVGDKIVVDAPGGSGGSPGGSSGDAQMNNGSGGFSGVSPGSSGNVLTSNGTNWTSAAPASDLPINLAGGSGEVIGHLPKANGGTGDIAGTTFDPVNNYVTSAGETVAHSAATVGQTDKLPPSPSDSDTVTILNASGGGITASANGGTIYGSGSTEALVDGETATYRFAGAPVSAWMRLA